MVHTYFTKVMTTTIKTTSCARRSVPPQRNATNFFLIFTLIVPSTSTNFLFILSSLLTPLIFISPQQNSIFCFLHRRVALEHNEYHQFHEIICTFSLTKSKTFHIFQSLKIKQGAPITSLFPSPCVPNDLQQFNRIRVRTRSSYGY